MKTNPSIQEQNESANIPFLIRAILINQ